MKGGEAMASSRIDVRVDGKDNTSAAFQSVSTNISKLGQAAGKAGATIGQAIGKGAQTAATTLGKLGSTATSVFQKIAAGAAGAGKSVAQAFDGISGAITGLLGGYGAMNVAQLAWSGAVSADFNKQFLATKMGTDAANNYVKTIQDIVSVVPGPDSWMNNLLSGAVAKQTNLSSTELKTLADMSASYYLTATGMGKSSIETQNDLNEYIKTGNTAQLERDSILKDQLPLLEGQGTVSERIAALQEAMVADGYDQVSNLNTLGNKWETVSGLIGKAATSLGNAVAPYIMQILGYITDLDTQTKGWSTQVGLVGVALVGIVSTVGMLSGPLSAMVGIWRTIAGGIVTATTKLWEYVVAAKAADKADDGVGQGGAGPGKVGQVGSWASNLITSVLTAVGISAAAGGTWVATGTSIAMGLATGIAQGLTSVAGAIIYPAIWGLFQDGSLLSGNWSFADSFGPQAEKIKRDFNGIGAYGAKTWNDLKLLAQGMGSAIGMVWTGMVVNATAAGAYIRGAWTNTTNYLRGAWTNTMNWLSSIASGAASAVIGTWNWIKSGATGAISTIGGAWGNLVNWVGQGVSGTVHILSDGLYSVWSAVTSLYNTVRAGAQGVVSIVQQIISGPGGPLPAGPGGPESGMSFNYENYGGWKKNAWTGANSMSGNCADMTTGLIARFGGSMVSGTWNGNPHVWWRRPDGTEFDPARKALNGTGSPPPRGPNTSASGNVVVIQGDVYGFKDFQRKVEQANNRIMRGTI
jgi:hypothetical protein